jgi:chromosomal replication initiation ATPase DnaA
MSRPLRLQYSEEFLQHAQLRVGTEPRGEIPVVQQQPGRPTLAEVVAQVARGYEQSEEELRRFTRQPSEARQVAVYAARRLAGSDLRTIGAYFGLGYTGVSRRVQAVTSALQYNEKFRARVQRMLDPKVKT